MLVGGNPISGFSHQPGDRSAAMVAYFTAERIKQLWRRCESAGITGVVARADAFVMRMLLEYRGEGGQLHWIAQTAPEHRDLRQNAMAAQNAGAAAIYLHGGEADRMFESGDIDGLRQSVETLAGCGLPIGLASHVPEHHLRACDLGLPLDFHMVCLYNIAGYRGTSKPVTVERFEEEDRSAALRIVRQLPRPAVVYKIYAAGRLRPDEAYADVSAALRPCDGVCVGMFPPDSPDIVGENVRLAAAMGRESAVASAPR